MKNTTQNNKYEQQTKRSQKETNRLCIKPIFGINQFNEMKERKRRYQRQDERKSATKETRGCGRTQTHGERDKK